MISTTRISQAKKFAIAVAPWSRWLRLAMIVCLSWTGLSEGQMTVEEAKMVPLGSLVDLQVVVNSSTDLVNSSNLANFHVQDATGGASIIGDQFLTEPFLDLITAGDELFVFGITTSFAGVFEVEIFDPFFDIIPLGVMNPPTATPVTTADLQDFSPIAENLESTVVDLRQVQFLDSGTFQGATNYVVTDGTDLATIRIMTNMLDLVGQPIPTGLVDIRGVLGQFDTSDPLPGIPGIDYQVQPRSFDDIRIVPEPPTWLTMWGVAILATIRIGLRRTKEVAAMG